MSDTRHHQLLLQIDALYKLANDGLPMPSPGRAAKALADFLTENPKWPIETLSSCVAARFASRGINLAAPPHVWIKTLPSYARGPLDEWGKPIQIRNQKLEIRKEDDAHARRYFDQMERELGR